MYEGIPTLTEIATDLPNTEQIEIVPKQKAWKEMASEDVTFRNQISQLQNNPNQVKISIHIGSQFVHVYDAAWLVELAKQEFAKVEDRMIRPVPIQQ